MSAFGNVRSRGKAGLSVGLVLLGALVACATAPAPSGDGASKPAVLADVRVVNEGPTTVVSLVGAEDPVFTAFQQEDPARVVVDLQGVVPGEVADHLAVYDGTLDEISVASFPDGSGRDVTRVELALGTVAEHEVVRTDQGLEVRVTATDRAPLGETEELAAESLEDPWAWEPAEGDTAPEVVDAETLVSADDSGTEVVEAAEVEMAGAEGAPEETGAAQTDEAEAAQETARAAAEAPAASTLLAVDAQASGEGVRLALTGDGRIDGASHFALEDPVRLVVDLPGLVNRFPESRLIVGDGPVERVRIGQHEDKVRVVVDAADGVASLEPARLAATADGLVVGLAGAGTAGTRTAATPEPRPATAGTIDATPDGDAPLRVYGVQFDAQAERDRITILTDDVAGFRTVEPDADTLMVRIPGASIDPEAEVNLAPSEPGVVSLVTAFEQPEMGEPEVRVVIRKATGAEAAIRQEGTMLVVDFPRDGSVAEAVPAVSGVHAAAVGTQASEKAMAQTARDAADETPAAIAGEDGAAWTSSRRAGWSTARSTPAAGSPSTSRTWTSTTCCGSSPRSPT